MKMYPEKQTILQTALPYLGSLVLTAAIFLALPLTQWASDSMETLEDSESISVSVSSPPPAPLVEPPVQEEEKEEDVELDQEMQKISLSQIDMALNVGTGGATTAIFNFNSFPLSDDFGDDLVFEVADLDEKPKPIVRIAPKYPANLKRAAIQGRVLVIFIVDEKGQISNARIVESPHEDFSESVLNAVRSWKFQPGKKDGKAVKTRVRMPLSFSLRR